MSEEKKIKAPQWLIDRMERLRKRPPPTAEQVKKQIEASIRIRKGLNK